MSNDPQNNYAESAASIGDITSHANVEILRRLRDNDPELTGLVICDEEARRFRDDMNCYCPSADEDLGWAGHFIGGNTNLSGLTLQYPALGESSNLASFFRGVGRNNCLQRMSASGIDLSNGEVIQHLEQFFQENASLCTVEVMDCEFGAEVDRLLSSLLRSCSYAQTIFLLNNLGEGDRPTSILEALGENTQLKGLHLMQMHIERAECLSLASCSSFSNLEELHLLANNIDDQGVEALSGALADRSKLCLLELSFNPSITARGVQSLANLLEIPTTQLEILSLIGINVGDEGAIILARALARNCKLEMLGLVAGNEHRAWAQQLGIADVGNGISTEGWQALANALCDTSSIDRTYDSNHTLTEFGVSWENRLAIPVDEGLPRLIRTSLMLNRKGRGHAAVQKIISHHLCKDSGMQRFSEMNRAILPHFIAWVPSAELSLLYRFVRSMPSELGVDSPVETKRLSRSGRGARLSLGRYVTRLFGCVPRSILATVVVSKRPKN